MPIPALDKVSTAALRAELQRRADKLQSLLVQRDEVDRRIAELESPAGGAARAAAVVPNVKPPARKAGAARQTAAPAKVATTRRPQKRGVFKETAEQFLLGLLKNRTLTTRQLAEAWKDAGRGGTVDSDLSHLAKAGKVQRTKLAVGRGSEYRLA